MIAAKNLAFIEPTLSTKCCSFRKRQYDENDNDEHNHPRNLLKSIIFCGCYDNNLIEKHI